VIADPQHKFLLSLVFPGATPLAPINFQKRVELAEIIASVMIVEDSRHREPNGGRDRQ
jgi:hypothetical protein